MPDLERASILEGGNPDQPKADLEESQNFSDGSGPIFNMYMKMKGKEDDKIALRWQKDANGILVFTGLFSAAVSVLLAVSILDLKPDQQEISSSYLKNIVQLADPNLNISVRSSILANAADPPPFSPKKSAILVNLLWFLSLAISLTCALLATLLQQWARQYVTNTNPPHYSPHKQARIHAFFADGIDKLYLPWAVGLLPTLLHLSLFLFFTGLVIFLSTINPTIFHVVVSWVGLSGFIYICITLMPTFRHDSPYYAPLSLSIWYLWAWIRLGFFYLFKLITTSLRFQRGTWLRFANPANTSRTRLSQGMVKTAEEAASKLSTKLDGRVVSWLFEVLDEDHEWEQFFKGIPGFCNSTEVTNPREVMTRLGNPKLAAALAMLLNHTWSSNSKSKEIRPIICVEAINALDRKDLPLVFLHELCKQGTDRKFLQSVQFGHSLKSWACSTDIHRPLFPRGIIAGIIAAAHERDSQWEALVKDHLGISDDVLRNYLQKGDSVLLANWIHITRQWYRSHQLWWGPQALELIQPTISKFDIEGTLPGLQHDFCALWNDIVSEAYNDQALQIPSHILRPIRHIYIALHQGTGAAPTAFDASTNEDNPDLKLSSSYPLCNSPGRHSHMNAVDANATSGTTSIIASSHNALPLNVENNYAGSITSPNSATAVATQGTSTSSPSANSEPVLRPATLVAPPSVTLSSPLPSGSTIVQQRNTNLGAVPPSTVPHNPAATLQPAMIPHDQAFDTYENSRTPDSNGGATTPTPASDIRHWQA